jgi:hypothetical protein
MGAPLKSRGTTNCCCPSASGSISVAKLEVDERRDNRCVLYFECSLFRLVAALVEGEGDEREKMELVELLVEDVMIDSSYAMSPLDAAQRADSISICCRSESIVLRAAIVFEVVEVVTTEFIERVLTII